MQLFETAFRLGLIAEPAKAVERARHLFVCPMLLSMPDDGVLTYGTIENAADFVTAGDRTVVMFREDQAAHLKLVIEGQDFFDTTLQVMYGVAGATYADWFDAATNGVERVSYQGFLSEYQMTAAALALEESKRETKHDRERKHVDEEGYAKRYGDYDVGIDDEDDSDD